MHAFVESETQRAVEVIAGVFQPSLRRDLPQSVYGEQLHHHRSTHTRAKSLARRRDYPAEHGEAEIGAFLLRKYT